MKSNIKSVLENLPKEQLTALIDEMHFACTQVSVFPIMEELLKFMEA